MTAAGKKQSRKAAKEAEPKKASRPKPVEPIDMVDGIPDRSPRAAGWLLYVLLAAALLAWLGLLAYVWLAG